MEWQCPPAAVADDAKLSWVNSACEEGIAWIKSQRGFSDFNKALDTIPLPGRITFHSIIGDRGKGNTPASSDGVVPYWSSHITPVASELIVPSHHSVQDNPMAATELKRILKLHLNSKN